jgi:aspartate/methionine/tyrosine aminotransferase
MTAVLEQEPRYAQHWLPELTARRDFLVSALAEVDGIDAVSPAGGFFVMAKVAGCTDSRALATDLIEHQQVVTIPGRFFGETGEGYLRLSYGAAPIDRLREACARLATFMRASAG